MYFCLQFIEGCLWDRISKPKREPKRGTVHPGGVIHLTVTQSCYSSSKSELLRDPGHMLSAARRFVSTPGARAFAARGAAVATAAAGVGAFSAQCASIKINVTIPVEIDVDQLEAALKKGKVGTADSLNILLQE